MVQTIMKKLDMQAVLDSPEFKEAVQAYDKIIAALQEAGYSEKGAQQVMALTSLTVSTKIVNRILKAAK